MNAKKKALVENILKKISRWDNPMLRYNLGRMSEESLRSLDESIARAINRTPDVDPGVEPPLLTESGTRNLHWIKWYRTKTGCGLREAVDEINKRVGYTSTI